MSPVNGNKRPRPVLVTLVGATGVRRMARLTNAFRKKWENLGNMLSLFFGVFNFCKVHGTLKTTPAVAAALTDHVSTVRELLERAASMALPTN
jgi:hypothetical protein